MRPKDVKAALEILVYGEFPGGLVVRIRRFHCHGLGLVPGRGTEIP